MRSSLRHRGRAGIEPLAISPLVSGEVVHVFVHRDPEVLANDVAQIHPPPAHDVIPFKLSAAST
jgi:hypothetical protein